eukprot:NODE_13361_length_259_cov_9.276190_g12448_i0.p1 GENE.NODE_13361_length_259_cov_9.276190_g12448_i0~~NODE_13361_length_259_cov_9.276190_g12448_i0.p1  ORF type:complete len:50 (+),score=15.51 NODE_13361_length_259_cov_9.276190_g12448_i0:26-151(+)
MGVLKQTMEANLVHGKHLELVPHYYQPINNLNDNYYKGPKA